MCAGPRRCGRSGPRLAAGLAGGVAAASILARPRPAYLTGQALQRDRSPRARLLGSETASSLAGHNGTSDPGGASRLARHLHLGSRSNEPLEPLARSTSAQRKPSCRSAAAGERPARRRGAGDSSGYRLAWPGQLLCPGRNPVVLVRDDLDPAQVGYTPPAVVLLRCARQDSPGSRRLASWHRLALSVRGLPCRSRRWSRSTRRSRSSRPPIPPRSAGPAVCCRRRLDDAGRRRTSGVAAGDG